MNREDGGYTYLTKQDIIQALVGTCPNLLPHDKQSFQSLYHCAASSEKTSANIVVVGLQVALCVERKCARLKHGTRH